jgi:hypothetical protein
VFDRSDTVPKLDNTDWKPVHQIWPGELRIRYFVWLNPICLQNYAGQDDDEDEEMADADDEDDADADLDE